MKAILVYITTASEAEARTIAKVIVTDRLAACANIIPGMKSIYHWEGKIEEESETVLILKTRAELFPAVVDRVTELHGAETPCILSLPVDAGHRPFIDWMMGETKP